MSLKAVLAGSASVLAILTAAMPSFAQTSTDNSNQPETVVVTGLRYSEEQSLDLKRNSDTFVDAIVASDIGKLPDKNVADALQRLAGVTTFSQSSGEGGFDENDRVALRGTSPSLTLTTIDGHSVATGDWYILDQFQTVGRSVSYDMLPSEIVSSAIVYKSQQADMIEGGTAGTVDIITRKPLDFANTITFEGSAQAEYSDLPHKMDPQINGLIAWHDDTDHFGFLLQGFYEERDLERQGQEILGYTPITAAAEPNVVAAHPDLAGVFFPNDIGAALFRQHRTREGGAFSAQWKPTSTLNFVFSSFYSKLDAGDTNDNLLADLAQEFETTDTVPTSYTVRNNTLVSATFPKSTALAAVDDAIDRPDEGSSTWYVDGDATWTPTSDLNVHVKAGYTRGLGITPSQPTWESSANSVLTYNMGNGGPIAVSFPNINTGSAADLTNDWSWSDKFSAIDKEFYTQADAEYDLSMGALQSIKFGARYDQHMRLVSGFDEGTCAFCGDPSTAVWSGDYYPGNFGSGLNPPPGFIQNVWYPNWSLIQQKVLGAVTPYNPAFFYWPGSFDTKETVYAGYAMANFGGDKWKGNAGIRYVNTSENVTTFVSDAGGVSNAYGNYSPEYIRHDYVDPLPSANFSYNLTDDQVLRAAAARVISRPDFSALGGAVALNDAIYTGTGGNPNLKPVRSWDYQIGWEWYFAKASLLSVTAFYTDLTTDVDFGSANATYLNATLTGQTTMTHMAGVPVYSSYSITSPVNGNGTDKGVEFEWDQDLWYGFGLQTNATISDGEQGASTGGGPLIGDSKYVYNLVGYYEDHGFSARVAYTWRSATLVGLDRSTAEFQAQEGTLALSASYNVTDNVALTFDALNLNDPILKYYAGPSQPRAFYDNGRQFYFGVKVKY